MAKGRILAIDGEEFYQRFYRNSLEAEGFVVETAANAAAGLTALRKNAFDLVIIEVKLSDADGFSLIDSIRKYNQHQDILVATGQQDARHAVRAMKLGISDYLLKPINHEEFQLVVNRILFRQSVHLEHQRLIDENIEFHSTLAQYRKCLELLKVDDLDRLGDLILDTLMEGLSAEGGALWLALDAQKFGLRCRRGLVRLRTTERSFTLADNQWQMVRSGKPRLQSDDRIVVVPLEYEGTPLGLIRIESPVGRETFQFRDVRSSGLVAEFAATALNQVIRTRKLERSSLHAAQDGAYNPAYYHDYADKELYKARRYNRRLSCIRLVVDNMDRIKGLFNQKEVEAVQAKMLDLVNSAMRDADVIAMHADDSYSILLPETDYWGSLVTQRRLRNAFDGELKLGNMKRDARLDVYMRSASFPADGATVQDLENIAERRLERLRSSVFYNSDLVGRTFWPVVERLLGRSGEMKKGNAGIVVSDRLKRYEATLKSCYVEVSEQRLIDITRALCREVIESSRVRGIIYASCADFDAMKDALRFVEQLESTETSFILLGGKKRSNWNLQRVVPVHVDDRQFEKNVFLFYMNEDYAYAFIGRRTDKGLVGFHTSDFYFVENMIAKLQDQYQLRAQV